MAIIYHPFEDSQTPLQPADGVNNINLAGADTNPDIARSADVARSGAKSLRFRINRLTAQNIYRAEVAHSATLIPVNQGAAAPSFWLGFSLYVPDPYPPMDYPTWELFFQHYMTPPIGVTWADYANNSPPVALYLAPRSNTGGEIHLLIRASDAPYPQPFPLPVVYSNKTEMKYTAGQWTDIVMNTRLDSTSAGIIKIWINGELKINRLGANYARGHGGANRKFGIYNGWKTGVNAAETVTQRTLYFDEYRYTEDVGATYEDVAPSGTITDPEPVVREPFATAPTLPAGAVYGVDFDARRQGSAEVSGQGITYNYTGAPTTNAYRPVSGIADFPKIYTTLGEPGPLFKVGGHQVGSWYEYTATVSDAGTYIPKLRCASPTGPTVNPAFRLYADGALIAEFSVPSTGSYDAWQTVESDPVALTAGTTVFRVESLATGMGFHRFWLEASAEEPVDPPPPPPPPPPPGTGARRSKRKAAAFGVFGE